MSDEVREVAVSELTAAERARCGIVSNDDVPDDPERPDGEPTVWWDRHGTELRADDRVVVPAAPPVTDVFRYTDADGDELVIVRADRHWMLHAGSGAGRGAVELSTEALRELVAALAGELDDDPRHVIELRADGWTIKHPLACRPALFDCPVSRAAGQDLTAQVVADRLQGVSGRFECDAGDFGDFQILDRVDGPAAGV